MRQGETAMHIDIAGTHLVFPPSCACCARKADIEYPLSAKNSKNAWTVPYCHQCVKHVETLRFANSILFIASVIVLVLGLIAWFLFAPLLGILLALVGIIAAAIVRETLANRAKKQRGVKCVGVGKAVRYLGDFRGVHRLDIQSREYAYLFMVANQRHLSDLAAEARALLEARGAARN